jgi:MFS family permease
MTHGTGKHLPDYYLATAVNSIAATLFLYCSYFWAKHRFGYSDAENLLMGAGQGLAAVLAARFGGKLADRVGYDRQMLAVLPLLAVALLLGSVLPWKGIPAVTCILYAGLVTSTWPCVEASIMHAPSRFSMPVRLGIYNVTWSLSGAAGYLLSGFIFPWNPSGILWAPALMHLGLWAWLSLRPSRDLERASNAMSVPHRGHDVAPEVKRGFLHTAWLANAAGYFMITAFIALAPHLGERFGLGASHAIWLSCSLLFARGAAFLIFWQWEGWHYRMSWSQSALWLAPASLAAIFFSPSLAVVLTAFVVFGCASGLTYYTSIYYSLDYGENKGEHGGLHESILGLGILLGPLAGALGSKFFGGTVGGQIVIVACSLAISAAGMLIPRPSIGFPAMTRGKPTLHRAARQSEPYGCTRTR